MNKSKIFIIYDPGTYGSFVSWWLLNANLPLTLNDLPFSKNKGHAHNMLAFNSVQHVASVRHLEQLLAENDTHEIYLLHPPAGHCTEERSDLNYVIENAFKEYPNSKILFIGSSDSTALWILNNVYNKISNNWFELELKKSMIIEHWGIYDYDDCEVWQRREMMSYSLESQIKNCLLPGVAVQSLMESTFINEYPEIFLSINVSDFKNNLLNTLALICEFCNVNANNDNYTLLENHWRETQTFVYSDELIKDIIISTDNREYFQWRTLTQIEESYLQYKLRSLGYEIKCNGLNQFPTNNTDLKRLLYKPINDLTVKQFTQILVKYHRGDLSADQANMLCQKFLSLVKNETT